jgi:hypothetical protein
MRALGLAGSLAIGCLVMLGTSCGSDDDNKGDGGTGGSASTGGTGGSSGSGSVTFSCDTDRPGVHYCVTYDASNNPSPAASGDEFEVGVPNPDGDEVFHGRSLPLLARRGDWRMLRVV